MTTAPLTPEAAAKASAEDAKRIKRALTQASGNVLVAAEALGVAPRTLHRRIAACGLRDWLTATYPRSKRPQRPDAKAGEAAADLLETMYLHPHYRLDYRSNWGACLTVLDVLAPEAARLLRKGEEARDVRRRLFPREDDDE